MNQAARWATILLTLFLALLAALAVFQRKLLYYPTHHGDANGLSPWTVDGVLVGYARIVARPRNIWLFTHGNAGQAADRVYALPCFAVTDSVYILEYPGYGRRPGSPGKGSFNAAARQAYLWLRKTYPSTPVCAVGESIGSGPAASLASLEPQPDKIVLVVPFDNLAAVARRHFPFIPAALLLLDRWDNVKALKGYRGKLEIFAAAHDQIIPAHHARALARSFPGAAYREIPAGHNDWPQPGLVSIRNDNPDVQEERRKP